MPTHSSGDREAHSSMLGKRTSKQRFESSICEQFLANKDLCKISSDILSKLNNYMKTKEYKKAYEISGLCSRMVEVKSICSFLIKFAKNNDINDAECLKTHFLADYQII